MVDGCLIICGRFLELLRFCIFSPKSTHGEDFLNIFIFFKISFSMHAAVTSALNQQPCTTFCTFLSRAPSFEILFVFISLINANDPNVRGEWCSPRFPTADETVEPDQPRQSNEVRPRDPTWPHLSLFVLFCPRLTRLWTSRTRRFSRKPKTPQISLEVWRYQT